MEVRANSLVLARPTLLRVQDFPHVRPLIKNIFLKKEIPNVPPLGRLKFFVKNWQKVTTDPVILSYVEDYLIPLVEISSQNSLKIKEKKNDCTERNKGDVKRVSDSSSANRTKPEQFVSSIFMIAS